MYSRHPCQIRLPYRQRSQRMPYIHRCRKACIRQNPVKHIRLLRNYRLRHIIRIIPVKGRPCICHINLKKDQSTRKNPVKSRFHRRPAPALPKLPAVLRQIPQHIPPKKQTCCRQQNERAGIKLNYYGKSPGLHQNDRHSNYLKNCQR